MMIIDFMNIFYENSMFMKHKFYYFSIYIYVILRKRYKNFKDSQIAMNESLKLRRSISRASIHKKHDLTNEYKVGI